MSMGTWNNKVIDKRKKGSQTPGSAKGANCQADSLQRWMAKTSRSYKHPEYGSWCRRMDLINGMKR